MKLFSLHSIFFRTTLLFVALVFVLLMVINALAEHDDARTVKEARRAMFAMIHQFNEALEHGVRLDSSLLEQSLEYGFEPIKDDALIQAIHRHGMVLKLRNKHKHESRLHFKLYLYKNSVYLFLSPSPEKKIAFAFNSSGSPIPIYPIGLALLFVVALAYFGILRSLLRVKTLQEKINRYAHGESDVDFATERKDEIAFISNAFSDAAKQLNALTQTRRLFIRNIMHELKTPIATGKVTLALLEDSTYKQTLNNVFDRQESLLEEFVEIESIQSGAVVLNKQQCNLDDIIDEAKELLFNEHGVINVHYPLALSIEADFSKLSIAVKNLIDNGLRYSTDHTVTLKQKENTLYIENRGAMLEKPLEAYISPYALQSSKEKESRGFGFGIFISYHICLLHGFKLTYLYHNETNRFAVHFK